MLRFVYDNDVLEHLHSEPYKKYIPLLVKSLKEKKNVCYISELNFHELIKGVNEKNFMRLQEIIRKSYDLSGNGNVLLNPYDHIINSIKKTDEFYREYI